MKAHTEKMNRTLASNAKALKQAETKAMTHVSQAAAFANIQQIRFVHWFEKFNWFISSEGYLVLSGRDAQQNEILIKRCAATWVVGGLFWGFVWVLFNA